MEINISQDVEVFIKSLEKPTIAKVLRTIDLLEQFGHELGMPHSKKVARELFELRIRGQQETRIFYTIQKGVAVLLHGFVKKSDRVPLREFKQAIIKLHTLDVI